MAIVEVGGLFKKFNRVPAIKNVSIDVAANEVFGIIGPDGAGKTTLLRILAGVLSFDSGRVMVCGHDVEKDPEAMKDRVGVVPQSFSLYPDLTVKENMEFFASMYQVGRQGIADRVKRLLDITKLRPFLNRRAEHLSGGMQKKLALITSLLHTPQLLLLDEPTTGVDPVSRRELWDFFYDLLNAGTTIIVSTPYMDEAERCARVGFLYQGELLQVDHPDVLKDKYAYAILESSDLQREETDLRRHAMGSGIVDIYTLGDRVHVVCEKRSHERILEYYKSRNVKMDGIEPTFEDVFISLIRQKHEKH